MSAFCVDLGAVLSYLPRHYHVLISYHLLGNTKRLYYLLVRCLPTDTLNDACSKGRITGGARLFGWLPQANAHTIHHVSKIHLGPSSPIALLSNQDLQPALTEHWSVSADSHTGGVTGLGSAWGGCSVAPELQPPAAPPAPIVPAAISYRECLGRRQETQ